MSAARTGSVATAGAATSGLVRPLSLPAGYRPPEVLVDGDLWAHAITRDDLDDDVLGINASLDLIARTRGGGWPTAPVTAEENYVDLVWHELEFREGHSLTYVLRDQHRRYVGCAYLYPVGRRVPLDRHIDRDVDVSWWVTPSAYADGYYVRAYQALRRWLNVEFPFTAPVFSNRCVPTP